MKAYLYISLMLVTSVALSGCSADYGKIHRQADAQNQITIKELADNWEDYDIYSTTRSGQRVSAVMFDPKNDDRRLVGKNWLKISDPVTLAKSIRTIEVWYRDAKVGIIQSPDKQVFGYMYYPANLNIPVKRIDEKTLYVSTLPMPKSGP